MQNYVGQQIDRYRIIERLGMGGMAVVYKAFDTRLERDVALKLIRVDEIPASQHERLMKRFEREAKAMAKFSHPNIVPVYDYGEVDGSPYLVMEFIPGGTLKDKTGQPIPVETALSWIAPIADALAYAHEFGVVHRDVKPSNILFEQKGRPILTDFGVAKVLETDEATLTGTGMGVGTPEYMAPEQWRGKTCPATDQYALGVVLYELLTGQKPYSAETPLAVALKVMSEPLPRPSDLAPDIPEEVEKVLYKALARDPQDRYEDMVECKRALLLTSKNYAQNFHNQERDLHDVNPGSQNSNNENITYDESIDSQFTCDHQSGYRKNSLQSNIIDNENQEKIQSEYLGKIGINTDGSFYVVNTDESQSDRINTKYPKKANIIKHLQTYSVIFGLETIGAIILSAISEINFVFLLFIFSTVTIIFVPSLFSQMLEDIISFFQRLSGK